MIFQRTQNYEGLCCVHWQSARTKPIATENISKLLLNFSELQRAVKTLHKLR